MFLPWSTNTWASRNLRVLGTCPRTSLFRCPRWVRKTRLFWSLPFVSGKQDWGTKIGSRRSDSNWSVSTSHTALNGSTDPGRTHGPLNREEGTGQTESGSVGRSAGSPEPRPPHSLCSRPRQRVVVPAKLPTSKTRASRFQSLSKEEEEGVCLDLYKRRCTFNNFYQFPSSSETSLRKNT